MKRFLFLIFLIIFSTEVAQAQDESEGLGFDYGIKFGVQVADLITDNNRLDPRPTFQLGVMASFSFFDEIIFQPELIYSRQGQMTRGETDEGVVQENITALDYINIPLMAQYYIGEHFYLEAGPQIGYLIKAENENKIGNTSTVNSVQSNYQPLDLSANLGVGFKTDWGFAFGLRYSFGINNILKEDTAATTSQRNAVLQMHFGYFF